MFLHEDFRMPLIPTRDKIETTQKRSSIILDRKGAKQIKKLK
jgi:hypothetical protein